MLYPLAYVHLSHTRMKHTGVAVDGTLARFPEWLAFHIKMGMEHFFVYDNGSPTDNTMYEALLPYITRGLVTHVRWPVQSCHKEYRSSQYAANNACIRRY